MKQTRLDIAHQHMQVDPDDTVKRLGFYERLCDAELFLLLETEPLGENIKPMIFPVDNQQFVLVFDSEDRLAEFTQKPSPYICLSGRAIVQMLAGQTIGLGINLTVAPSSMLLDTGAVEWLDQMLAQKPKMIQDTPIAMASPVGVPERLIENLAIKFGAMSSLATSVYLVEFEYKSGVKNHVIVFVDAIENAQTAMSQAVSEALSFSGEQAGLLDVVFLRGANPIVNMIKKVGLEFELPELPEPKTAIIEPPGMNPDKPPKLR